MWAFALLIHLLGLVSVTIAGYVLQDDYSADQFFAMFDFFTDADPTHGFVQYVDQTTAQTEGLINTSNGTVYMGVDHTSTASSGGRTRVRLTSKKSYNHGLIILDLSHMPGGICGTWPAFWSVGPRWPSAGEIDIIEGVNVQNADLVSLHTSTGCNFRSDDLSSDSVSSFNCDANAANQGDSAACSVSSSDGTSYGAAFNAGQGGVYAAEWTSDHISIWFFPRSAVAAQLVSVDPDPTTWGPPMASFSGGCDIDQFFYDHQIVFDTTFCGDWAGKVWSSDPVCSGQASSCEGFVQDNPAAFQGAYWLVNSLKVYQSVGDQRGGNGTSSPSNANTIPTSSTSSSSGSYDVPSPSMSWQPFPISVSMPSVLSSLPSMPPWPLLPRPLSGDSSALPVTTESQSTAPAGDVFFGDGSRSSSHIFGAWNPFAAMAKSFITLPTSSTSTMMAPTMIATSVFPT